MSAALVVVGMAPAAFAQTTQPAVKILKGVLQSPDDAAGSSGYGTATTSTDGLCATYGPGQTLANAEICPSGGRPRAPEIKALARALKGDPNLIYEYVRN